FFGTRLCLSTCHFRYSIINELHSERIATIEFDHDIRRFDVAVHHTAGLRSNQGPCGLLNYLQRYCERHWAVAAYTSFERFAVDELHGIEALAVLLAVVSDPSDIWMANVCRGARLS